MVSESYLQILAYHLPSLCQIYADSRELELLRKDLENILPSVWEVQLVKVLHLIEA